MKTLKRKNNNRFFTLLEIMIVIVMIGTISGLISLKVNKALYKHEFQNNIKKFDNYVEFCKKMAFSNQSDIYMNLKQNKKKIDIEIGTDTKMGFFKDMKKTHDTFDNMVFDFNDKRVKKMEIVFTSNGEVLTKGEFKFMDVKKKFKKKVERKI